MGWQKGSCREQKRGDSKLPSAISVQMLLRKLRKLLFGDVLIEYMR